MTNFLSIHERVPNSPYLNQPFYVVFNIPTLATFTGAYCSVGSVIAPIAATGSSWAAFYQAGTVATGTYDIKGFLVKGATGTFVNGTSIRIRDSDIPDPVLTVYSILKNNVGAAYSSVHFTTGWGAGSAIYPVVTVTKSRKTDETYNLFDTFRYHNQELYVDTWMPKPSFGVGQKNAQTLLDNEVKRIINAFRKAPSTNLRHMQITNSQDISEVTDPRKMFRTRHTIRIKWDETVS